MKNKIDKEDGLINIALNAVSIHHKLQGLGYDDILKINHEKNMKFVVMLVGLPTGSQYYRDKIPFYKVEHDKHFELTLK